MKNFFFKYLFLSLSIYFLFHSCVQNGIIPEHNQFDQSGLNYRILYPKNFDESKKYPLMLFLHGIGERGDDNELQLKYIDKVFLNKENYKAYPSIVIFPQAPLDDNWSSRILTDNDIRQFFPKNNHPTKSLKMVMKLLDSISSQKYVDKNRIYLTGLSNGAMGSFELLKHRPHMFAAAVLICGGGNPLWANEFSKTTPVWVAHGSDDDVVFPEFSINMVKAIKQNGGSPKLTLYENVGHDSWFNVFQDPEFLKWIYSHSKN